MPPEFAAETRRRPERDRWLDGLPRLVADLLEQWQLRVGPGTAYGQNAVVLHVRTRDGERAALKVGWPHRESTHEHLALRAWAGTGAVRLLRADPHRGALLLERAEPGHDLHALDPVEACQVVAGLYAALHRPPLPQLDRLSGEAARWSEELGALRGSALAPRRFVDQASRLAADFAADPGTDAALLHGDLHYANVLAADREPWLVIDPHPLAGDPAFEVAPLLRNRWDEAAGSDDLRGALLDRLYAVVDTAELDEDRVRDWVVVREMVNVLWASREVQPDRELITRSTTIVKAVQR